MKIHIFFVRCRWSIGVKMVPRNHENKYSMLILLGGYCFDKLSSPLYCLKCRQENLIEARKFQITVITEPELCSNWFENEFLSFCCRRILKNGKGRC